MECKAQKGKVPVLSPGASVPLGFGVSSPPITWMHAPTQKLSEPYHFGGFYGSFSKIDFFLTFYFIL